MKSFKITLLIFGLLLMGTVNLQAVEIFRAGTYPQGTFSQADLQKMVDRYDVAFLKAPNTLDHAQSGPAFGHVTKLATDGKILFADMEVASELADQIKAKKYLSRSVEFFRDLEGKGMYLKAVSWLGAKAPQVKGLADVDFAAFSEAETETIEFAVEVETPEAVIQFEELQAKVALLEQEKADLTSKFSQTEVERNTAREALQALEISANRTRFETFLNEQIAFGTLAPANKTVAMSLLEALNAVPMFDNQTESPVELFQAFIKNQPKVEFSQSNPKTQTSAEKLSDYEIVKAAHEAATLTTI